MVYNIYYELSAFIILLVFAIATRINYPTMSKKNRIYVRLVLLVFVTGFFDIFTAIIISYKDIFPRIVNLIGNEAYFMFGTAMCYMLSTYVDEYIVPSDGVRVLQKTKKVVLWITELVIVLNTFGGFLFYVTEDNVYTHSTFFYSLHVVSFFFILLTAITIGVNGKILSKEKKMYGVSIIVAYILPTLIQILVLPDTLLIMVGGAIIMIITFFSLESPDYIKLQETLIELDAAKEEAIQANNAKGHFLANMSHEIRTPINAVLGMNTMILRKSKDSEIRKYASDIQSAGRNLLSIINDILDFSKIESGKMELVPVDYDFSSLVNDVYNMISAKARDKDLEFILEVDENIPSRMYGDDVRIRQVLVNLLTNAVKYTPSGKVWLSISRKPDSSENESVLHFEVKDTGIGIKAEDISKLTEEFVRIEESRNRNIEGTGLGINIVVSLLALMGSKLEVDSIYGEGSTFHFTLTQPIMNEEKIGNISERINGNFSDEDDYLASFCIPDSRLLVVDDNPMNLSVFTSLLSDMLCQIDEADSGAKCLELVKENKYDIIFMDHMMPEMDGIVTFHYMQEFGDYINAKTPVVILTANAISGAKEIYLNEGFTDYLSKPIDVDKLEAMIGKLIPDEKKQPAEKKERPSEVSIDIDLPFIDGVDWKHAILKLKTEALLMDSIKNFSSMAQMDIKILIGMYEKVIDTNEQSTFDEYRIKVHSMKSNVATIGADHVAGLAKYLEYAAKDYNLATIQNLMPLFESEWNKLKEEIDETFGFNNGKDKGEKKSIDVNELEALLDVLKEAMEEADLDRADAVVEELSEYSYPQDQMDLLEEIKMAVLNIDEDLLVKVIEQWNILIK